MSFFFFLLHPLPTVGKGLALKAVPRCLETATMLKKHSIMWLFWKCGDSSCKRGSAFSAGEHVFDVCSCRTGLRRKKKSEKTKKKLLKVFSPGFKMKCKEIYHLNMQIILSIFQSHMQYIRASCNVFPYQIQMCSYFGGKLLE